MTFWRSLLNDSQLVSNTTIVCQDGVVYSHKLVVASLSEFIKNLVNQVPANDGIAFMLPDFKKRDIENLIREAVLNEDFKFRGGRDLNSCFMYI